MTYNIMIDEEQREIIEAGLEALMVQNLQRSSYFPDELRVLKVMVTELPEKEAEHPGNLHGFCL